MSATEGFFEAGAKGDVEALRALMEGLYEALKGR